MCRDASCAIPAKNPTTSNPHIHLIYEYVHIPTRRSINMPRRLRAVAFLGIASRGHITDAGRGIRFAGTSKYLVGCTKIWDTSWATPVYIRPRAQTHTTKHYEERCLGSRSIDPRVKRAQSSRAILASMLPIGNLFYDRGNKFPLCCFLKHRVP